LKGAGTFGCFRGDAGLLTGMSFIAEVAFVEVFVGGRGVLLFAFLASEAAVFFVVAVVFCTLPIAF
jgi:hypothetical protein